MANEISVVMCTYNGGPFLGEQLQNIRMQTLPPTELVVCDDGSNDETLAILESCSGTAPFPVRIHRNRERLGSTKNFDRAIHLAKGDLIVLCDQDDRWKLQKLDELTRRFEDRNVAGVFTDASLIDDLGRPMDGTLWSRGHLSERELRQFRRDPAGLLLRQDVATGATMAFRSCVRNIYGAIPEAWVHDGWLAWMMVLHASCIGRLEALPQCLIEYRVHPQQQTGKEATQIGSRIEPLGVRLKKARHSGHVHHQAMANRLRLVLNHLTLDGYDASDSVFRRIAGTIDLLDRRSALPTHAFLRALRVLSLLPAYLQYGRGLSSAARDTWA